MRATKPIKLFEAVIKGMLPKTRLKYQRKLKVYAGDAHPHAAQAPTVLEI
jgi:large subunit ribosomal protein L13